MEVKLGASAAHTDLAETATFLEDVAAEINRSLDM